MGPSIQQLYQRTNDTNVPGFVYLGKTSLHVSTLTSSSSGESKEFSHLIAFLILIHIITIFYHLFSEYIILLKYNLTNTYFFKKLSLKIKIKIKYIVWININTILIIKLITRIMF
jgi:hypothetical protein